MSKLTVLLCSFLYSLNLYADLGPTITLKEFPCQIDGHKIKFLKKGYKNSDYNDGGFKIFIKDSQKEVLIKEASIADIKVTQVEDFICGPVPSVLSKNSKLVFILGQMNAPFGDKAVVGLYNLKTKEIERVTVTKNSFKDAYNKNEDLFLSVTIPRSDFIGSGEIEEVDMSPVFKVENNSKSFSLVLRPLETVTSLKLSRFLKTEKDFYNFFKVDKNFKEENLKHWLYLKKEKNQVKCIYASPNRKVPNNFSSAGLCI